MNTTMLLCDAAQVAGGTLHILGGGWTQVRSRGGSIPPTAVALLIEIPWDRLGERFATRVTLCDADGATVVGADGATPLVNVVGTITTTRTGDLTAGAAATQLLAISIPPLRLAAGRYDWRLDIDEEPSGNVVFEVDTAAPAS